MFFEVKPMCVKEKPCANNLQNQLLLMSSTKPVGENPENDHLFRDLPCAFPSLQIFFAQKSEILKCVHALQ